MIKVRVPATSANIGPGFDALGLALDLYNTYIIEEIPSGLEITGCDEKYKNEENLVYTSMLKTFQIIGYDFKGIRIHMDPYIPESRGLGSSAACILGGVMAANELAGGPLSKTEILMIATEIEGHPDNIAPALYGGLVVSVMVNNEVLYNPVDVADGIKFVALIPNFTLSTKEARSVLPSTLAYKDAVYNVGRVALLLSAFSNGRFDLLKYGIKDRLHQPYRGKLIPDFDNIINKCDELGAWGTYLSGAGPTIMALINKEDKQFTREIRNYLNSAWQAKELNLDLTGVTTDRI